MAPTTSNKPTTELILPSTLVAAFPEEGGGEDGVVVVGVGGVSSLFCDDVDGEFLALAAVAGRRAEEVVGARGAEGDGGGAVAVGADGGAGVAAAVVTLLYFVHSMGWTIVEHCNTKTS